MATSALRINPPIAWEYLLQPDIMFPAIVHVVLIKKALTKPQFEVAETDLLRVVVEHHAALVSYAVFLAMNVKAMEMGIAPTHSNLNGVMEIGDALVAAQ